MMSNTQPAEVTMTSREMEQIQRANASSSAPVVFVHGLWLLPSSWDRWAAFFEEAGYVALTPGWPDDPETVKEANEQPEVFAHKSVSDIADYVSSFVKKLEHPPVVIGHSFGGLMSQIIAGRGLASAAVAIDPAPFRGVLPLPYSVLRASRPVLGNPANLHRAVPLTYEQFRYGFANAVSDNEAKDLYETYAVPGSGTPVFQAAAANLNPWTEVKVDTTNPQRGPLLIISGEKDHTVPRAVAHAAYEHQRHNDNPTEFIEIAGRGHALTSDNGWREVAETTLKFITEYVAAQV